MPSFRLSSGALALTFATTVLAQTCGNCQSFGVDFQSGGSYFQNSLSTSPFTAVQEFEGCSNDTSHNVLVDPNGNQYECSLTPMQPDDTPETLTCPIDKDQMSTGDWSLLILSNNGDCDPIDYQRDFFLSVGPQQTVTVSPTLTIHVTSTPVKSEIVSVTSTITSTAHASTKTVPAINFNPTITIAPLPAVTVVTRAILTLTSTSQIPNVVATSTAEATATCNLPERRKIADPIAKIAATILADLGLHLKERESMPEPTARPHSGTTEYKRAILEGRAVAPQVKARWLAERREALALNKRAPDQPTVTVTAQEATSTVTVSESSTYPTITVTGTTTILKSTTTTPVVTVSRGINFGIATVTLPQNTLTNTFWLPATEVVVSATKDVTLTITSTVTPSGVAASCSSAGGTLSA